MNKIGDFIDLCVMFHVKNCKYKICSNCIFVGDIYAFVDVVYLTNIFIISYQDENQENQVKILHEFSEEYFGNFCSMTVFLRALDELEEQQKKIDQEFKKVLLVWNGGN